MAALKMSVKHGLPFDVAKAHFEKGIKAAEIQHGNHIKQVEWSDDRTRAKLSGTGFAVELTVDHDSVHADGHVPFFVKFLEGPIRKFVEQTVKAVD